MLNWLYSRPLQIKFFLCTVLLVSAVLLVFLLNVLQVLNQFLSHHIEDDMQQRTHILALTLMVGPAAHNQNDLQQLLEEMSALHGYCYLSVQNSAGKVLGSAGDVALMRSAVPDAALADDDRNGCFKSEIPLLHDGKSFGLLRYGVDTSFIATLESNLRTKLLIISALWLVIGTAVYFFLVRRLVKPLQAITRASELMAQGNLNTSMPGELPQDELGKLASSFQRMATSLRERIESQQSYAHALYAEQARLNALLSIIPVGILFVDHAHNVQYINLECRRLWGLDEGVDYIGQQDTVLVAHAHDAMDQPGAFAQHLDTAIGEYGISPSFYTPLRNGRIIRCRSCVVPDAAGKRYIGRVWIFEETT